MNLYKNNLAYLYLTYKRWNRCLGLISVHYKSNSFTMKYNLMILITIECVILSVSQNLLFSKNHKIDVVQNIMDSITSNMFDSKCLTISIVDTCGALKSQNIKNDTCARIIRDEKYSGSFLNVNAKKSFHFFLIPNASYPLTKLMRKYYNWRNYEAVTLSVVYISNVSRSDEISSNNWLKSTFVASWTLNITRILVYYWSDHQNSLQWFNYNVYSQKLFNRTGDYNTKNYWQEETNMNRHSIHICFYNIRPFSLIFRNRFGKTIYSGIDGYVMKNIMQNFNASYSVLESNDTYDSRLTKSRNALANRSCDILFTSQYIINDPRIHYIYPVARDAWCAMVPKAGKMNDVIKLVTPLSSTVWFFILACTNCIFVIWWAFRKLGESHLNEEDKRLIFLDIISILLNISISPNIAKLSSSVRTLVMSLVLYNFFVSFSYLGLLFGSLMKPIYHKDMNTLNEIRQSGLKVMVHKPEYHIWLKTGLDNREYNLSEIFLLENNMSKIMDMRENNNVDYGYAVRRRLAVFFVELKSHQKDSRPIYHLVEECFFPMYSSYAVNLNFPFSQRIEKLIRRYQEAGLVIFWDMLSKYDYGRFSSQGYSSDDVDNLIVIFRIWSLGILLCFIVFILEFIINKSQLRNAS